MKDLTSNPVVLFLSCIVSAFLAGIAVLNFFYGKVDEKIKDAKGIAPHLIEMPIGTVLAWDPILRDAQGNPTGETRKLPENWLICNGKNGTPDLSNRFLMGVKESSSSGNRGGANIISNDGSHNHGGRTAGFAGYKEDEINWDAIRGHHNPYQNLHKISNDGAHNHGGDNRPAFYSVLYIIKL